jgi:8-oxo-dGTP pyrophosphatase MutT (NUDIX family)
MTASRPRWKPNVTVAAVIEREGRFLLVEEHTSAGLKLNTPAGHLDPGESPAEGCARETLEETAHHFTPDALVGVYMARFQRPAARPGTDGEQDITYLRFAFAGTLGAFEADRTLDDGIVRTLLLRCIEDYLAGQRYPLELIHTDASVALPPDAGDA